VEDFWDTAIGTGHRQHVVKDGRSCDCPDGCVQFVCLANVNRVDKKGMLDFGEDGESKPAKVCVNNGSGAPNMSP